MLNNVNGRIHTILVRDTGHQMCANIIDSECNGGVAAGLMDHIGECASPLPRPPAQSVIDIALSLSPFHSAIQPELQQLFADLCTEQILMLLRPAAVKSRKKHRKVATEVADLKSKLSQSLKNIVLSNREIRLLRFVDLTDEEKDKLRGSYKVARKLDKLESMGQER